MSDEPKDPDKRKSQKQERGEQPPPESKPQTTTLNLDGVSLRDAIKAAREFLLQLVEDKLIVGPIQDLVLEGVSGGKLHGGDWVVILGYRVPGPFDTTTLSSALASLTPRRSEFYKAFVVDRHTAEVTSMTPYEPERH